MRTPYTVGLGLLIAGVVSAQQQPQLKARELFYTPITEAKPAPAKESVQKEAAKASASKAVKPKPTHSAKDPAEPVYQASKKSTTTLPEGVRVQNTSTHGEEVVGPPLALKYRLLKGSPDGRYDEVDTDTVFKSGDKIRVSVESNDSGHLYIVQQGSSKTWNLLFPNEDTDRGSNRIQRNREYEIPGGGRFTFDEQPGSEKMFIVLSRRAEPDLEKLIYALSRGASSTQPAAGEKTGEKSQLMIAQNSIDDTVISRLRGNVLARDLVFEKVNDDAPVNTSGGTRKEKAMYVATPDRSANARVVVDLTLNHQ
jgi:hypothetical protein